MHTQLWLLHDRTTPLKALVTDLAHNASIWQHLTHGIALGAAAWQTAVIFIWTCLSLWVPQHQCSLPLIKGFTESIAPGSSVSHCRFLKRGMSCELVPQLMGREPERLLFARVRFDSIGKEP